MSNAYIDVFDSTIAGKPYHWHQPQGGGVTLHHGLKSECAWGGHND